LEANRGEDAANGILSSEWEVASSLRREKERKGSAGVEERKEADCGEGKGI
jgi:hypothetical protein